MLHLNQIHNQKNTVVLSAAEVARIKRRANPFPEDEPIDEARQKQLANHEKTMSLTKGWSNSIANERQARITRLQKEAEKKEQELQEMDRREKQIQKENKQKILAEAQKKAFLEKPEIRSVHAQLLLHEVVKERQRQVIIKERRKELEQQREEAILAEERRILEEEERKEQEAAQKRREANRKAAESFKEQAAMTRARKQREKEEEAEDEAMLAQEAKRLLDEEQLAKIKRMNAERANAAEVKRRNEEMEKIKARQRQLEKIEEQRLLELQIKTMDEQDARQEIDRKRRQERQAAVDSLIERQAQNLAKINAQKQEFEDKMSDLQFEKERKHMMELQEKTERLARERRQDYLDAQKKLEAKRALQKNRRANFPVDSETEKAANAGWELELRKQENLREIAEFQRRQAEEKREREAAEKERARLEYVKEIEDEEARTAEAQEYAREMLLQIRQKRRR